MSKFQETFEAAVERANTRRIPTGGVAYPISGDATKVTFNRAMMKLDHYSTLWNQPGVTTERY